MPKEFATDKAWTDRTWLLPGTGMLKKAMLDADATVQNTVMLAHYEDHLAVKAARDLGIALKDSSEFLDDSYPVPEHRDQAHDLEVRTPRGWGWGRGRKGGRAWAGDGVDSDVRDWLLFHRASKRTRPTSWPCGSPSPRVHAAAT